LAEQSDLVAELMAELKGKQRGISRTWKEVPAKSSFVSIMVCSQFLLQAVTVAVLSVDHVG
jgi:hypothetical protein